ncbi:MAG: hypothetical protein MHM6MM_002069 [Cercozoa sp. M6MM]
MLGLCVFVLTIFHAANAFKLTCAFLGSKCVDQSRCTGQTTTNLCPNDPWNVKCCYTGYDPAQDRNMQNARCSTPRSHYWNCGDAYEQGRNLGPRTCTCINNRPVIVETARAFDDMNRACPYALTITSGFRTMDEQEYFYRCYMIKQHFGVNKCNNGNLAGRPGYSNHQNGKALDISVSNSNIYRWLTRNAQHFGFVRTVPSETWHWEFRPGSKCDAFVKYSCLNGRND